jgi:hypothetical protein
MPKQKQNSKQIINKITGEVITSKDIAIENIEIINDEIKQIDKIKNNLKKTKKDIKEVYKLDDKELVYQTKFFYKSYKIDWNILKDLKPTTFKVLKFLESYMNYKDNSIIINNKHLTFAEMAELSNTHLRTFENAIKELKNKNIVKIEKKRYYSIITLNPQYVEDTMTERKIHRKFNKQGVKIMK